MNKLVLLLLTFLITLSCSSEKSSLRSLFPEKPPKDMPLPFKPELTPEGMIIHGGSFSPDLNTYLYTLSDARYERFDVYMIQRTGDKWSASKEAFFNSEFSEHGAKFSPDGNTLYFTSTRPTGIVGVADTWHIWKSKKQSDGWSTPVFVDIPNLRQKLVSHPSITASGNLFFHASNPDYSEMTLYVAESTTGKFGEARKLAITENSMACTPFVTADGQTLVYAAIGNELDLMISKRTAAGDWGEPMALDETINTHAQGNPYLTPDGKYLFYTTGTEPEAGQKPDWQVNRVDLSLILSKENN
ncbi:MAG: hypothetical protein Roseis2KO_48360 [Roseivirga sp.]